MWCTHSHAQICQRDARLNAYQVTALLGILTPVSNSPSKRIDSADVQVGGGVNERRAARQSSAVARILIPDEGPLLDPYPTLD